jgi:hypothetical protein
MASHFPDRWLVAVWRRPPPTSVRSELPGGLDDAVRQLVDPALGVRGTEVADEENDLVGPGLPVTLDVVDLRRPEEAADAAGDVPSPPALLVQQLVEEVQMIAEAVGIQVEGVPGLSEPGHPAEGALGVPADVNRNVRGLDGLRILLTGGRV